MQTPSRAPMTKIEKLRWYTEQLMADAAAEEKAGTKEPAVAHYLEAAEILLLLAKTENNYTAWKYYAESAATCQQRARKLIALGQNEGQGSQ